MIYHLLISLICITFFSVDAKNYCNEIDYSIPEQIPISVESVQDLIAQARLFYNDQKYDLALETCKTALLIMPQSSHGHLIMGKIYTAQKNLDAAMSSLTQACDYRTQDQKEILEVANAMLMLGNSFFDHRQSEKAITIFKKILTISDNLPAVHHNIAFTMYEQTGEFDTAIRHYKKALEAKPDGIETHFCNALALLATGDLVEGFREYEYRWKRVKDSPRTFQYPMQNQLTRIEDAQGKRVLIRVEQGLGDTLHFIRYAKLLKQAGATVIAELQSPLAALISICDYVDEIVIMGNQLPHFDFQIPMITLPVIFKTTLETVPTHIPYLRADPQLIDMWRSSLPKDNFRIGICWRGDAAHGDSKFMPLEYFLRLAKAQNISFYSLQKIDTCKEGEHKLIEASTINCFDTDFDNQHGRFMDTAAVMKNLDLVITVDTSIAHLAGGLGIPVWLVLPFPAEWRWLTNRSDSPWYPTMRLFRQTKFGDWESVYNELLNALKKKIR